MKMEKVLSVVLLSSLVLGACGGEEETCASRYKIDEDQDNIGVDQQDALDFQKDIGQLILSWWASSRAMLTGS